MKDLNSIGSKITLQDLKNYKASENKALVSDMPGVEGYKICTVPPPAGGVTLINILNILKGDSFNILGFVLFLLAKSGARHGFQLNAKSPGFLNKMEESSRFGLTLSLRLSIDQSKDKKPKNLKIGFTRFPVQAAATFICFAL